MDGNGGRGFPALSEVHHQLLGLADAELEVVLLGPSDKALHHTSVPFLPVLTDAAHNGASVGGTFQS